MRMGRAGRQKRSKIGIMGRDLLGSSRELSVGMHSSDPEVNAT